jgi:hypothetical protein
MATESIGTLIPTAIPGYTDSADIQAALRAYHYGSYSYDPANTSTASLVTPSMAKTIYDIQTDITSLENRPSSGGEVDATQPAPADFTPPEIPDGFIWVDQDGTVGGQPTSATSVFTNSAPTTSLTTGVIWVDKDPVSVTNNPFIPQALISAKGDIVVGTANDTASVLSTASTNGYILSVNSSTTSGLAWIANDQGDITAVTSGTGITVTNGTGPIPSVAIDTTVTADLTTAQTLTNKTLTSPTLTTPALGVATATSINGTTIPTSKTLVATDSIVSDATTSTAARGLGYMGVPQSSAATTGSYTIVAGDAGEHIYSTATRTITIPADASVAFPVGTAITFIAASGATVTIAITSDTLLLAGAGTTGSRTLAPFGMATAIKITSTSWIISGNGLT